jgi:phage tail-like protein
MSSFGIGGAIGGAIGGSIGGSASASAAVGAAAKSASAPSGPVNKDMAYPQTFFEIKVPALNAKVGYFTQVQGMSAQVDVLEYPEGGRNDFVHKLPGRIKQGNITLKRGLTTEAALLAWFKKTVVKAEPTDMSLTLYDTTGKKVQAWKFAQAYPVKWTASDLNSGGNEIMTETLEIAHSGMASA